MAHKKSRKIVAELPSMERDLATNAILNRSRTSHTQARARKANRQKRERETAGMREDIALLRKQLDSVMAQLANTK